MAGQRVRRIVVDGRDYGWRVRPVDERWVSLRVWADGENVPMADIRVAFDDPWLRVAEAADGAGEAGARDPVRPGQVADLIRACAGRTDAVRELEFVDGELRPVG